jgi:hypothetical protein
VACWGRFIDLVGAYGRGNRWGRVWCEEEEEGRGREEERYVVGILI